MGLYFKPRIIVSREVGTFIVVELLVVVRCIIYAAGSKAVVCLLTIGIGCHQDIPLLLFLTFRPSYPPSLQSVVFNNVL